jgi:GT2 family glycosyltransferase
MQKKDLENYQFKYDLSICILTCDNLLILINCINSIINTVVKYNFEIIIVDSSKNNDTFELIKRNFEWIKYIRNKVFNGFSSGNNQAIKISSGKFICILNDDTILLNECIDSLLDQFYIKSNVGAIGPKILNPDRSLQISSFLSFPNLFSELVTTCLQISYLREKIYNFFNLNNNLSNYGKYNLNITHTSEVKHLMGACIIIPVKVIDEIGGLDENFFLSMEDQDWCRRILKTKRKVIYYPDSELIHLGGQTVSKLNETFNKIYLQSKLYFFKKYNPFLYPFYYFLIILITLNNLLLLYCLQLLKKDKKIIFNQLNYELNKFNYLKFSLKN